MTILTTLLAATLVFSCTVGSHPSQSNVDPSQDVTLQQAANLGIQYVSVSLKPLDAPSNPYRNQYQEWDQWAYQAVVASHGKVEKLDPEHLAPMAESTDLASDQSPIAYGFSIDAQGYLLPSEQMDILYEQAVTTHAENDFTAAYPTYVVRGLIKTSIQDRLKHFNQEVRGRFYPPIPAWLAANPPYYSQLLPNGDVICRGALGSGFPKLASHTSLDGHSSPADLHRYSHEGILISSSMNNWWQLFHPGDGVQEPAGIFKRDKQGYITYVDAVSGAILSRWDFDCSPLPLKGSLPERDKRHFYSLFGGNIVDFFNGQQKSTQK